MKIKAKKAIIGFASISAVLVAGLGTTLGVLLSQKKTNDTVKITMDNVYSIRDYLFKRYTKVLTDAADSQSYIESQIAKVQSDVDTIIQEGINGSFPAETIYANIYAYGYRINIDIYD
jgi:flagellar assembly factor FliW